ncbi:MAG TPA: tRNA preQ1(34) S-adenosylmethionine ribosyltransferase-isomerase QueA [Candidatus Acidoferrales bacterium]|nr:tRNA preQ1(34) S-adenosylmethionine ribosyltransferase-isomerase QueA [Candidatus Acidoferrales bacterium]
MLVSDFDYNLPPELIAKTPLAHRADARMLHLRRGDGTFRDTCFPELPALLRRTDLLVLNNTRVIPARLFGRRAGLHSQPLSPHNPAMRNFLQGRVELLLTKQLSPDLLTWEGLVRPGRKINVGERLIFDRPDASLGESPRGEQTCSSEGVRHKDLHLEAEVIARGEFGERTVRFSPVPDFLTRLDRLGHIPLPPYIDREDTPQDREQYQTVYAQHSGSVAAPTAGLHFTPEVLDTIRSHGVEIAEVTLHVGLGTFQPIRASIVEEHHLHTERYEIGEDAAEKIARARRDGRRIVAIGTTSVRTLEYAASLTADGSIFPQQGEADIFIYPGFQFRVVGAMLTNFHLPQSTLLMLVSAFAGREFTLRAYNHAVAERYRFFSYGDCMFIE